MRAFVTGIGGFVGPHLAAHLAACGDRLLGSTLDAARRPLVGIDGRPLDVEFVVWNVSQPPTAASREAIRRFRPEAIYHLAAVSLPAACGRTEPTEEARAANVAGVAHLLDLLDELPDRPRLLFISSSHVYGPVTAERPQVSETDAIGPTTGYGRTKAEGERLVARAVAERGADAVTVRAFKHAGPGQSPQFMLAQWARQMAHPGSQPLEVQCLDSHLDLSDVRDVVRAYRLLVERGERGETYNVGSGIVRRSGDLFFELRRAAAPDRAYVETQPGRRQEPIARIDKLVAATGWRPQVPLAQTLLDVRDDWRRRAADEG